MFYTALHSCCIRIGRPAMTRRNWSAVSLVPCRRRVVVLLAALPAEADDVSGKWPRATGRPRPTGAAHCRPITRRLHRQFGAADVTT